MSQFGNVPAVLLVGTVERVVSKMDEGDLAATFERDLWTMLPDARTAFFEAIFDAFRNRGESSEDAAEGAGTTLEAIARTEPQAIEALIGYARANEGLLKEATALFVERRPDFVTVLPMPIRSALAERLALVP
jgi:hypothetical protein